MQRLLIGLAVLLCFTPAALASTLESDLAAISDFCYKRSARTETLVGTTLNQTVQFQIAESGQPLRTTDRAYRCLARDGARLGFVHFTTDDAATWHQIGRDWSELIVKYNREPWAEYLLAEPDYFVLLNYFTIKEDIAGVSQFRTKIRPRLDKPLEIQFAGETFYFGKAELLAAQRKLEKEASRAYYNIDLTTAVLPYFSTQSRKLSCEAAAATTLLRYLGYEISEEEFIREHLIFVDPRQYQLRRRIWGDPDAGFVGSIDGSQLHRTGYGIYPAGLKISTDQIAPGVLQVKTEAEISQMLNLLASGRPFLALSVIPKKNGASPHQINWLTPTGKQVIGYINQHMQLVVGFRGTLTNPEKVIVLDPLYPDPQELDYTTWQTNISLLGREILYPQ